MTGLNDAQYAVKLLDLVPNLKRVASTGGGEYAGACPFCGGRDRFRVHPESNRWYCRQCGDGKWHDVVDFIMRRDQCSLKDAAKRLNVPFQINFTADVKRQFSEYKAPDQDWQKMAMSIIDRCQSILFSDTGKPGMDYLLSRGLKTNTIKKFKLGYSPAFWVGKVKVPKGITIPAINGGVCRYIKIRSLQNDKDMRYLCVSGSKSNALFNGDDVSGLPYSLVTEGEFNAMILDQEIGDVMAVCSLGSAANKLDALAWGRYFLAQRYVLCLFDDDPAGEKGFENMQEFLGKRVKRLKLPKEGDINDFLIAGGDVWQWLKAEWKKVDPDEVTNGN